MKSRQVFNVGSISDLATVEITSVAVTGVITLDISVFVSDYKNKELLERQKKKLMSYSFTIKWQPPAPSCRTRFCLCHMLFL